MIWVSCHIDIINKKYLLDDIVVKLHRYKNIPSPCITQLGGSIYAYLQGELMHYLLLDIDIVELYIE